MGMAASQARFLGLTARKTNVEYQGQQVNQQRASLANESAGLYNQMVNLKLPMPPSAVNYYSSRYTFESAAFENGNFSILKFDKDFETNDYKVTLQYKTTERRGFKSTNSPSSIDSSGMTLSGNNYNANVVNTANDDLKAIIKLVYPNGINNDGKEITQDQYNETAKKFLQYVPTTGSGGETNYYSMLDSSGNPTSVLYYAKDQTVTKTAEANADLTTDDTTNSARFSSITLKRILPVEAAAALGVEVDANGYIQDGSKKSYDLEIKKAQDDEGYDEASKEYDYQKMLYDRAIQDINAKTEMIQQQDKNLELKLRQLDTEQKALQTEMEAVQKVIQKNVETTFKTFG